MALLSGAVGAIIGALLTALVAWLIGNQQIEERRDERRKDQLRDLVARYWSAMADLTAAREALSYVVWEMSAVYRNPQPDMAEYRADLERRRQELFSDVRESRTQAIRALALIRITTPDIQPQAKRLFVLAEKQWPMPDKGEAIEQAARERTEAFDNFEARARALLLAPPQASWVRRTTQSAQTRLRGRSAPPES